MDKIGLNSSHSDYGKDTIAVIIAENRDLLLEGIEDALRLLGGRL